MASRRSRFSNMRVASRIWSGIAVVLVAYIFTVAVGALYAHRARAQLTAAREQAFPATLAVAGAVAAFNHQLASYQGAVVAGEPEQLQAAEKDATAVSEAMASIALGTWIHAERRAALQAFSEDVIKVHAEALPIYQKLAKNEGTPEIQKQAAELDVRLKADVATLDGLAKDIRDDAAALLSRVSDASIEQIYVSVGVLIGSLLVAVIVVSLIISRSVVRPLNILGSALRDIAEGKGDLTRRLPVFTSKRGVVSNDELTQVSVSLNQFLGNLQRIVQQVAESARLVNASAIEVDALAKQVSTDVGSSLEGTRATTVAADSVSQDMSLVTQAVDDMSGAIREISDNSQQAARIASEAVTATTAANATMARLEVSTKDVGQVVKLINRIAAQTNLLAINATIEAASAGDAGRGFTVVAHEVKELAARTSEAITIIQARIAAIQTDAAGASGDLQRIGVIIADINTTSTSIAGAVEEQTATTQSMGQAVSGAARRTTDIKTSIDGVSRTAENTAQVARRTEAAARELSAAADELGTLIGAFKY